MSLSRPSKSPKVSVIVPTRNSEEFLGSCLESIKNQSYKNIELIVVDNNSTDTTKKIARKYTTQVYNKGPERSAQRNFGVKKASCEYVLFIDSDMELTTDVVKACVEKVNSNPQIKGIIIPEESFGEGFWAQCKKLERSFYVGVDWMEAARFFDKQIYLKIGGFNEKMVSGEDWDLSHRFRTHGKLTRTTEYILHNEGRLSLRKTLKKKRYYAAQINTYVAANKNITSTQNEIVNVFKRFYLYLSQPKKLLKKPAVGLGMLFMKTTEFAFGAVGYYVGKLSQ